MISIIIPTWNRASILEQTLQRLFEQDVPKDGYEIVVVDNACTDDTPRLLDRLTAVAPCACRVVRIEPNNLARARNAGVRAARGDVVVFIGDDILTDPFFVREHARFHAAHPQPQVAMLGRLDQIHLPGESAFEEFFDPFAFDGLAGQTVLSYVFFWTNNISLKRSFLLQYGLFDEDFHDAAHEDVELGYRLSQYGLQLHYNERLMGHHLHPTTLDKACRQQFHRGFTYVALEQKLSDRAYRERIGIFSWRNHPRRIVRDLMREALFNAYTIGHWRAYLERQERNSPLSRFLYWKVLSSYTSAGYRAGRRQAMVRRPELGHLT